MGEPSRPRILVTGAAAGIGLAIARRLAADNVEIVLADQNAIGLERAAKEIAARQRPGGDHCGGYR